MNLTRRIIKVTGMPYREAAKLANAIVRRDMRAVCAHPSVDYWHCDEGCCSYGFGVSAKKCWDAFPILDGKMKWHHG